MAIEKRGKRWRVRLRLVTGEVSATFQTKAEAVAFEAQSRVTGGIPNKSFGEVIDAYRLAVTPSKKSARWEDIRLRRTMKDPIADARLPKFCPDDVAAWRDRRLGQVSPASVLREWNTLQAVCSWARDEKRWLKDNPFSVTRKPATPAPRTRRISQAEVDAILQACGTDSKTARVGQAFLFALETAMRASEICGLTADRVVGRVAKLERTKNGHPREVPLSAKALEILAGLPETDGPLFGLSPASLDALFRKVKNYAGITDLHFHDTRAEALTRLSRRFNVMELAKISGHRDIRILQNTYYRETAEDLAKRMD